jgi:hypothetical protein
MNFSTIHVDKMNESAVLEDDLVFDPPMSSSSTTEVSVECIGKCHYSFLKLDIDILWCVQHNMHHIYTCSCCYFLSSSIPYPQSVHVYISTHARFLLLMDVC